MSQFRLIVENALIENLDYNRLILIEDFTIPEFNLEEDFGSIGKGATLLACIGACILGLANKPAEAMSIAKPTENIELTTNFEKGNEKGTTFQSEHDGTKYDLTVSDDGNCHKSQHHMTSDNGYSESFYTLDCQSPNGAYTVTVGILNQTDVTSDSNFSNTFTHDSISVEYNGHEKTVNLDDPQLKNLRDAVLQALQRDKQDNKIVTDMVNNTNSMGILQQNVEISNTSEDTTIESVLGEDTIKQGNSWTNKGKEGTHGTFKTKKQADAQRKAMFANGYKG